MSGFAAIPPLGGATTAPLTLQLGGVGGLPSAQSPQGAGFGELLMQGLRGVDAKLNAADNLVARFAVDDDIPVHQVTMALEEARLSVDLAMQVRGRLVEGYRELMNMQL